MFDTFLTALGTPVAFPFTRSRGGEPDWDDSSTQASIEDASLRAKLAMPYGMYISAEGAQAQIQRMEIISNNLANVDTPGFKRDHATFQARFAEAIEQGLVQPEVGELEDLGGGVMLAGTLTDFSTGKIKNTGGATDVAIPGKGFFQVRKGDQVLLTRAGNFSLDTTGQLITSAGYPVLSESGAPITINLDEGPFQITPDGGFAQSDSTTFLAMVEPASLGDLVKVGENLFSSLADTTAIPPAERRVLPGHLEMSGVNPTREMMTLIETSRAVEANMKMIQNQDSMISSLISRVLQG